MELHRYRVVRVIKTGQTSEILEASVTGNLGFERRVALKRLLPQSIDSDSDIHRFIDEARIVGQLHHANIVSVFDFGYMDGLPFQALELVEGVDAQTLATAIGALGIRIPAEIALYVALEVAHALSHAHEARDSSGKRLGIVHRDVNPSNILISRDGDIKLTDFGTALAHDRIEKTQLGHVKGAPAFRAPEQAAAGPVDKSADIFALGSVLQYLITGTSPNEGGLSPDLPDDIRAIVERATRPSRSERHPQAGDLAKECGAALAKRIGSDPKTLMKQWLNDFVPPEVTEPSHRAYAPTGQFELELDPTSVTERRFVSRSPGVETGATVQGYAIHELIGRGSMAKVHRATHLALDLEVAFKVLVGKAATDPRCAVRLRREARALGKVRHPNLVEVRDCGTTPDGAAFLVMALLRGQTLKAALKSAGRFSIERTADISRQIATGLQEAHRAGLVHRDLKPTNVMIVKEGAVDRVKILDFGLARAIDVGEVDGTRVTTNARLLGTPRYMAPEQIQGASDVGPPADLYALGGMMYAMLSGGPPFPQPMAELIEAHLHAPPPPLGEYGGLEKIAHLLLEKDPKARPQNAGQVMAMIDALGIETPASEVPTHVESPIPDSVPFDPKTRIVAPGGIRVAFRNGLARSALAILVGILFASMTLIAVLLAEKRPEPEALPLAQAVPEVPEPQLVALPSAVARADETRPSAADAQSETGPDDGSHLRRRRDGRSAATVTHRSETKPTFEQLKRRLRAALAKQGVSLTDLEGNPALSTGLERWRSAKDPEEAEHALDALEPQLENLGIDEALLKRKLARLGEVLERASKKLAPEAYGAFEDRYLDLEKDLAQHNLDPERARALARRMSGLENDLAQASR